GNSGPWTTVVNSAPNSGIYQWITPSVSSSNCYLKFTITSGVNTQTVITSAAFGIGACTTPPPTSVNNIEDESGINIFPNPSADGIFTIQSQMLNIQNVEVYNM